MRRLRTSSAIISAKKSRMIMKLARYLELTNRCRKMKKKCKIHSYCSYYSKSNRKMLHKKKSFIFHNEIFSQKALGPGPKSNMDFREEKKTYREKYQILLLSKKKVRRRPKRKCFVRVLILDSYKKKF